ncbi:MAG: NAD(P)-dependent oxidoreductase [Caulobacteraceae bacterium]|nr:NAD(P)-dependent oxidoreductase [Caulobacteraceae bacterium]
MKNTPRFAVIGFGEVGQILAQDLVAADCEVAGVFDLKFGDPASVPSLAATAPYRAASSAPDAVRGAQLIVSSVTAEQGLQAARSVAGGVEPGAFFLDVNSVSPGVKRQSAEAVAAAGGRYVEAAVMTAVPPHRIKSPMLLGGPNAAAFLEMAGPLGFNARVYSEEIGKASAVKMCRSVMIKGMEALITESCLTARRLGVEQDVLASLGETLPVPDWEAFARYMISRSLQHGRRRAEEMREVARTVSEAHVEPLMSASIAQRQDIAAELGKGVDLKQDLGGILDALLAKLPQ